MDTCNIRCTVNRHLGEALLGELMQGAAMCAKVLSLEKIYFG